MKESIDSMNFSSKNIRMHWYKEYMRLQRFYKKVKPRKIVKTFYNAITLPVVDLKVIDYRSGQFMEKLLESPVTFPWNRFDKSSLSERDYSDLKEIEDCERNGDLTDRSIPMPFDRSLAGYARKLSEVSKSISISTRNSYVASNKASESIEINSEPIDFLEKLKGVRSHTTSLDVDTSPKKQERQSITGLSETILKKIIEKNLRKNKAN